MFISHLLPALLPALALAAPSGPIPGGVKPHHDKHNPAQDPSNIGLSQETSGTSGAELQFDPKHPHHDPLNLAHDPYPSNIGLSSQNEQSFMPAYGSHTSLVGLTEPVRHETKKGHKKDHSVQLPETSPITLTSDMGPIKAYNRGLYVNPNAKTGSVCDKNVTDCSPYKSDFTWFKLAYNPIPVSKEPTTTVTGGSSQYNGTLKLDVAVPGGQQLWIDQKTGHIRYFGPHGTSPDGPQYSFIYASLSGGEGLRLNNEAPTGKYPGFWWLCPTGVSGEFALSVQDSMDGNFCVSTSIQFRYTIRHELAGAYSYN